MSFLIDFDCSLKLFFLPLNGFAIFILKNGNRDIYSLGLSILVVIIISKYLYEYDKKKISEEKEESLETLLPFQENKIIVKKVSKIEYSYGLKKIEKKCFTYSIVFISYIILNIVVFSRLILGILIKDGTYFFGIFAQILFYYLLLKEKLYRHHLVALFYMFVCSFFKIKFEKNKNFIFSFFYYSLEGLILCIGKVLMIKYYLSPYIFSIANGVGQLFLDLLKIIFVLFFSKNPDTKQTTIFTDNYFTIKKYNNYESVIKGIFFIIGNSTNILLNGIIIYYFQPFIYTISNDLGDI